MNSTLNESLKKKIIYNAHELNQEIQQNFKILSQRVITLTPRYPT